MSKKYLYTILLALTILLTTVSGVFSVNEQECRYEPKTYQGLQIEKLAPKLESTGIIGRIHGAAPESQMFVFSVREPNNFFNSREFSLLANNSATLDQLKQVKRHDQVCVQGSIIANPSPQKHIAVNSIQIIKAESPLEGFAPYDRKTDLPAELEEQNSLVAKVHVIDAEGKILVVDYQDRVIPVYVRNSKFTKNLYRGDIIELSYQIQNRPQQPIHLQLDPSVAQPLKVLDSIASWHNQAKTLSGKLVKFPQSPQLKFDIYAMEVETQGIKRYFTLVNFTDIKEFQKIRRKLAQIWQDNRETAVSGRNMLINPEVTIQAQGVTNIISPRQANPQILLKSAEQISQVQ